VRDPITFRTDTGRTIAGNMMQLIDAMVACQAGGGPTIEKLYIVYKEAKDWRKKHVGSMFASQANQREEAQVVRLMSEVIDDMNALQPGVGTALTNYQSRKTHQGVASKRFTSLGKGYDLERETYVKGKKQQAPYSGAAIKDRADAHDISFSKIKTGKWDELALEHAPAVKMYFVNKVQRLKHLAVCEDKGVAGWRWVNLAGANLDTLHDNNRPKGSQESCQMYALDRYGNLFVDYDNYAYGKFVLQAAFPLNPAKAAKDARGQTNHSSFCAGRDVICAGMIFFWNGHLIHIDNLSGHYSPNRNALRTAVEILRDAHANLSYLRVGAFRPNPDRVEYYSAQSFLQNVEGNPNWPNQDSNQDQSLYFQQQGAV
jgi:hypothetical protein